MTIPDFFEVGQFFASAKFLSHYDHFTTLNHFGEKGFEKRQNQLK